MNKTITSLTATVLLLAGVYLYASPYVTLFMLRNAIAARSATDVKRLIDFTDVRDSLRSQLVTHLQDQASKDKQNPGLAQFTAGVGSAIGGSFIDTVVHPNNLKKWLDGEVMLGISEEANIVSLPEVLQRNNSTTMRYQSFDTFSVSFRGNEVLQAVTLERRNVFIWRVVGIDLNLSALNSSINVPSIPASSNDTQEGAGNESDVAYVDSGPGDTFAEIHNGLLYYSNIDGLGTKPIGKPEYLSDNILKADGIYFCRWEGYAEKQVQGYSVPWECTAKGIRPRQG